MDGCRRLCVCVVVCVWLSERTSSICVLTFKTSAVCVSWTLTKALRSLSGTLAQTCQGEHQTEQRTESKTKRFIRAWLSLCGLFKLVTAATTCAWTQLHSHWIKSGFISSLFLCLCLLRLSCLINYWTDSRDRMVKINKWDQMMQPTHYPSSYWSWTVLSLWSISLKYFFFHVKNPSLCEWVFNLALTWHVWRYSVWQSEHRSIVAL